MEKKESDNVEERILDVIYKSKNTGLTITEIVSKLSINRSLVRITLARLEGSQDVVIRKAGMAKLYFPNSSRLKKFLGKSRSGILII